MLLWNTLNQIGYMRFLIPRSGTQGKLVVGPTPMTISNSSSSSLPLSFSPSSPSFLVVGAGHNSPWLHSSSSLFLLDLSLSSDHTQGLSCSLLPSRSLSLILLRAPRGDRSLALMKARTRILHELGKGGASAHQRLHKAFRNASVRRGDSEFRGELDYD
jgi:hypothetical protein